MYPYNFFAATIASYVYDGNGDRVYAIDYGTSATTAFVNDPAGLTQVLATDDGTRITDYARGLGSLSLT